MVYWPRYLKMAAVWQVYLSRLADNSGIVSNLIKMVKVIFQKT
jgi:hypothetical protein